MKKNLLAGLITLFLFVIAGPTQAVTIDFDSLEVENNLLNSIASSIYEENGFTITGNPEYSGGSLRYAGQLHPFRYAGSAGLQTASLSTLTSSAGNFILESIDISLATNYDTPTVVTFIGYKADYSVVASEEIIVSSFGFTTINFDFINEQELLFLEWYGTNGTYQIDNISIASPVPEPSTMLLLGSGLVGMVLYRRRQGLKQA